MGVSRKIARASVLLAALGVACAASRSNPCDAVVCTASDKCHAAGACQVATGVCSTETATACPAGQSCDPGDGACKASALCAGVTCTAMDQCHTAGTCNPSTGTCSNPARPVGTACNDHDGCTTGDACTAIGTCEGAAVACTTPSDPQCQGATGACTSTGDTSFTCTYSTLSNGTACNKDDSGCTQNDSCQNGACTAGSAVSCPSQTSNPCQASSGACVSTGNNSYACAYAQLPDHTSCNTAGACVTGQTCTAGACGGGAPFCPSGQTCDPSGPTCQSATVAPQAGKVLQLTTPLSLAIDTAGASYVGGSISSTSPIDFDGHPVASTGDQDLFLARYDATSHAASWAQGYGDDAPVPNPPNPQYGTGIAVTSDATLAVIGNFSGKMTFGSSVINSSGQIDFLAAVSASSGSRLWARQFNDGGNGKLRSVAANPHSATNRIAACGQTNIAATDFAPGATFAGGGSDAIIGVFNSAGAAVWTSQFGSPDEEECDAVAVDDNGDVYAAGRFDGATLHLGGIALTGPGSSVRYFLWVAKFDGSTGAVLAAAAFGNSAGKATPVGIAVDASGKVAVAGQFSIALPFGSTTLTSAGGIDAFVARLDPAASTAFAPVWAVRLGGAGSDSASGVGVDASGNVFATGLFFKTTTGAAALTASGLTAPDAFVLRLGAAAGATQFAASYGDASLQSGDAIAVDRFGTGAISYAGTLAGSATFPSPVGTLAAVDPTDAFLIFAGPGP